MLKERNLWCVGLDERGTTDYDCYDFRSNTVLVLDARVPGCTIWSAAPAIICCASHGRKGGLAERIGSRSGGPVRSGAAAAPGAGCGPKLPTNHKKVWVHEAFCFGRDRGRRLPLLRPANVPPPEPTPQVVLSGQPQSPAPTRRPPATITDADRTAVAITAWDSMCISTHASNRWKPRLESRCGIAPPLRSTKSPCSSHRP